MFPRLSICLVYFSVYFPVEADSPATVRNCPRTVPDCPGLSGGQIMDSSGGHLRRAYPSISLRCSIQARIAFSIHVATRLVQP